MSKANTSDQAYQNSTKTCIAHSGICAKLDEHDRRLSSGEREMAKLLAAITDIKDNLLKRPSWTVACIIGLMGSTIVGFIVYHFSKG